MALPSRPWVRRDIPLLWRDDRHIDVGEGARRCVLAVTGDEVAWLTSLCGDRTLSQALADAQARGLAASRARRLLAAVDYAGALDDAGHAARAVRRAAPVDRERLVSLVAAMRHIHGGALQAADLVDRRDAAVVGVDGAGPLADSVHAALCTAGVGTVIRDRPRREHPTDCHVLTDHPHPDVTDDRGSMSLDLPHLPVAVHAGRADVGPFVVPGRTACLACGDLHRRDADPRWPRIAVQWAHRGRTPGSARAADPTLLDLAAHLAVAQVVAFLDAATVGDTRGVPTLTGIIRVHMPGARQEFIGLQAHPLCGCQWPLDVAGAPETTSAATLERGGR